MSRKPKYTKEQKLWAVQEYMGGRSVSEIGNKLNMSVKAREMIHNWVRFYESNGARTLKKSRRDRKKVVTKAYKTVRDFFKKADRRELYGYIKELHEEKG